jgi:hypothetical protein
VRSKYCFATGYSKGFDLSNFMAASGAEGGVAQVADARGKGLFLQKNMTGRRRSGICGKESDLGMGMGMGEVVLAAEGVRCVDVYYLACWEKRRKYILQ